MRKFFFDDVRDRPGNEWEIARDVPSAKYLLANYSYDVWSLDHDIGFQMICFQCCPELASDTLNELTQMDVSLEKFKEAELKFADGCKHSETGTALVKWTVSNVKEWPQLVIIHSANPYGSERMKALLEPFVPNVQIIPYSQVQWGSIRWQ